MMNLHQSDTRMTCARANAADDGDVLPAKMVLARTLAGVLTELAEMADKADLCRIAYLMHEVAREAAIEGDPREAL